MAFQVGANVYAHANADVIMTPRVPGASRKTFLSAKSFEADANVESFLLEGTSHEAVAIGVGIIKPDWKISISAWDEILDYAAKCGPGYLTAHHDILIVFTQGSRSARVSLVDCVIEKGWGVKSESSGAPDSELSGKCRSFDINGIGGVPKGGLKSTGGGLSVGASVSIGGISLGVKLSF